MPSRVYTIGTDEGRTRTYYDGWELSIITAERTGGHSLRARVPSRWRDRASTYLAMYLEDLSPMTVIRRWEDLKAEIDRHVAQWSGHAPGEVEGGGYVCPQCGPGVKSDEDGCCLTCGADLITAAVLAQLQSRELEIEDVEMSPHFECRACADAALIGLEDCPRCGRRLGPAAL